MASMASSEDSPSSSRSSKPLSKLAESLTFSSRSGNHEPTVSRERSSDALARSQRRIEKMGMISPLFGGAREGWGKIHRSRGVGGKTRGEKQKEVAQGRRGRT